MRRWQTAGLLFGSGFAALVLQTAWLRELRLVFGVSTAASAAVLAVFMGGLGLGGVVLGRRADRVGDPLGLYSRLELGVAASAALTPLLLWGVRAAYVGVGGTAALGAFAGTIVRLLLSAAVLGLPTFLMGGTLPAAARAVETSGDLGRRHLALLYGTNTVGAVVGALASTFVLFELLGNRRTLWLACAVNALVAVAARAVARRDRPDAPATPVERTAPAADSRSPEVPAIWVLTAAGGVGFAFFLMELVWYRMLAPLLGGSTFTFGLILAVALAGIGVGGLAYAALFANRTPTLRDFAWTAALEAVLVALPFAAGDRLAIVALLLRELGAVGFVGHVAAWSAITAAVVFPAAMVSGMQFPLLVAMLGPGRERVGRQLGVAYLSNTAGAIAGALAGGFGLMAWLSAPTTWRLAVALLAALALAAAGAEVKGSGRARSLLAAAAALLAIGLALAQGPTAAWRHSGIGAGRYSSYRPTRNGLRSWIQKLRHATIWEADGVESSVAMNAGNGISFIVNGKSDGNAREDAGTQVLGGLLGALLHPDPKQALVIGLGTGSTAGWLGAVDEIERVDVVELEPAIVAVARACSPVNHDVLANPKVDLHFADAREWMLTTRERYDIVFSEPSNPFRAGIASLFTVEFYRSTRARLRPGGIFLQWLQAYEVDDETVETIYSTLAAVFPSVESWRTTGGDLLLVATAEPIDYDAATLRRRLAKEPFRTAFGEVWLANDLEGLLARRVAGPELPRLLAARRQVALNTDDRTPIEFGFARTLGLQDLGSFSQAISEASLLRTARIGGDVAGVDWKLVVERAATAAAVDGAQPPVVGALSGEPLARATAVLAWSRGDLGDARLAWSRQHGGPTDDAQLLAVAEASADAGDRDAEALAAELRERRPVEAAVVDARRLWRARRWADATASLEAAFEGYRVDPWPPRAVMSRALELADSVARESGDPGLGRRLFRALAEPFSVRMLDGQRSLTRLTLAGGLPGAPCNEEMRTALAELEPHVPWSRDLLAMRARCYAGWGSPLRERAKSDLDSFLAVEPAELLLPDPAAVPK